MTTARSIKRSQTSKSVVGSAGALRASKRPASARAKLVREVAKSTIALHKKALEELKRY